MITLRGIYTDEELAGELEYVCRVIPYKGKFYNGISEPLKVVDGDVLMMLGQGTWYALYRRKTSENAEMRDRPDNGTPQP